jgi:hypothetical protein
MYKFANKPSGDYNSWTHIGNTGDLIAGEGFTLKGTNTTFANQNYTYVGKPNNGLIELRVDPGKQYLIGNPYPSAIDAREFIKDNIKQYIGADSITFIESRSENIIDGNLYFWDHYGYSTHLLKSYQGGYAIYNLAGQVSFERTGVPPPPGAGKTPRHYIPVAQGFFVNGLATNVNEKIQFKNSQRIYKREGTESEFIRTSNNSKDKGKSTNTDLTPRIYLKYNTPSGFQRQVLVAFIPLTTEGIDIGYDALNNERFSEDMSWVAGNNNLVIQAIPTMDNRVLPLEVKVATKGIAKISIDLIENISENTDILLKDKETGFLYNLRTAAFEINLSPGVYTNRFEIILKSKIALESIEAEAEFIEDMISIYMNNDDALLFINKSGTIEIKEIYINNMLGQQLKSIKNGLDKQTIQIPFNVKSGVYIINVKTDDGTISKKVIKL